MNTTSFHLLALLAYTCFLLWQGFGRSPGFASWHMFARVKTAVFDLQVLEHEDKPDSSSNDGNLIDNRITEIATRLNPWDFLPHSQLLMSREQLIIFLFYLSNIYELDVFGQVEIISGRGSEILQVQNSRVVD